MPLDGSLSYSKFVANLFGRVTTRYRGENLKLAS